MAHDVGLTIPQDNQDSTPADPTAGRTYTDYSVRSEISDTRIYPADTKYQDNLIPAIVGLTSQVNEKLIVCHGIAIQDSEIIANLNQSYIAIHNGELTYTENDIVLLRRMENTWFAIVATLGGTSLRWHAVIDFDDINGIYTILPITIEISEVTNKSIYTIMPESESSTAEFPGAIKVGTTYPNLVPPLIGTRSTDDPASDQYIPYGANGWCPVCVTGNSLRSYIIWTPYGGMLSAPGNYPRDY